MDTFDDSAGFDDDISLSAIDRLAEMAEIAEADEQAERCQLTEAEQAALQVEVLDGLRKHPFDADAPFPRCFWVIFIGAQGALYQATLPVDDRAIRWPGSDITGSCQLVAMFVSTSMPSEYRKALVVLHRATPAGISEADRIAFRLVREACADRDAMPWTFHVVEPGGVWEVTADKTPVC